jgi:hypothetical protein
LDSNPKVDWSEFILWFDKEGCTPQLANNIGRIVKGFCDVYSVFSEHENGKLKLGITRLDKVVDQIVTGKKALERPQGLEVIKKIRKKMTKATDSVSRIIYLPIYQVCIPWSTFCTHYTLYSIPGVHPLEHVRGGGGAFPDGESSLDREVHRAPQRG